MRTRRPTRPGNRRHLAIGLVAAVVATACAGTSPGVANDAADASTTTEVDAATELADVAPTESPAVPDGDTADGVPDAESPSDTATADGVAPDTELSEGDDGTATNSDVGGIDTSSDAESSSSGGSPITASPSTTLASLPDGDDASTTSSAVPSSGTSSVEPPATSSVTTAAPAPEPSLTTTAPASAPATTEPALTTVATLLSTLEVQQEPSRVGYDRDLFSHWSDTDGNGCDAREDTLASQLIRDGVRSASDNCRIVSGTWVSIFDATTHSGSSSDLDIDHVVALAEAWDSGANTWSSSTRRRFANDPMHLIAVTASSNRSKSDRDLGEWRPARSAWCIVATITVETKAAYGLSVDPIERDAIAEMLDTCGEPGQVTVPVGDASDVPVETVPTDAVPTDTAPGDTAAPDTTAPPAEETPTADDDDEAAADGCVDINTAGVDDLDRIVNIGPSRADQMLGLRPFSSVDDMIRISGIGEASLAEIIEQGLACVR